MQLSFKNLAPLPGEFCFDLSQTNIIINKNDQVATALRHFSDIMSWSLSHQTTIAPKHVNPLSYIKKYMVDETQPVHLGYKRNTGFGEVEGKFEIGWDSEASIGIIQYVSFLFKGNKMFERRMGDSYLYLDGMQDFMQSFNAFQDQEEESTDTTQQFLNMMFHFEAEDDYALKLAGKEERVIHRKVEKFDPKNLQRVFLLDDQLEKFFSDESDLDLNHHISGILFQLSYQMPISMCTHYFKLRVTDATNFSAREKRSSSHEMVALYSMISSEKTVRLLKGFKLPIVQFKPILDDQGFYLADAFVFEDEQGVSKNISVLSVEDQVLIYLFVKLVNFERETSSYMTIFDESRLVDLSNLEYFVTPERTAELYALLRSEFPQFRFLFSTKRISFISELTREGKDKDEMYKGINLFNCHWKGEGVSITKHRVTDSGEVFPRINEIHYLNGMFLN